MSSAIKVKVRPNGSVVQIHAVKAYKGNRGLSLLILNLGPRFKWSASRPGRFTLGKEPGTHRIGGWVGSRAGLNGYWKREGLVPLSGFDHLTIQSRLKLLSGKNTFGEYLCFIQCKYALTHIVCVP